jgi:hypothetical protein
MTNEELIKKYKKIYRRKTGKNLSDKVAWDQAFNLITLVDAIYKPINSKFSIQGFESKKTSKNRGKGVQIRKEIGL